MTGIVVIPARMGSTRLKNKMLAEVNGLPLLWYTWSQVMKCRSISQVVVATDSEQILKTVEYWGGQGLMTSPSCQSGTERIASIINRLDSVLIINVQGDEPMVDPSMIDALVDSWQASPCDLITPVYRISTFNDLVDSNIVKVVRAQDGRAIYFSRSPIPFMREQPVENWLEHHTYWGHVGVYGYRRVLLEQYATLPLSVLEQVERLEQLRFLEAGYQIRTFETRYHPIAVDTIEDLVKVRQIFENQING